MAAEGSAVVGVPVDRVLVSHCARPRATRSGIPRVVVVGVLPCPRDLARSAPGVRTADAASHSKGGSGGVVGGVGGRALEADVAWVIVRAIPCTVTVFTFSSLGQRCQQSVKFECDVADMGQCGDEEVAVLCADGSVWTVDLAGVKPPAGVCSTGVRSSGSSDRFSFLESSSTDALRSMPALAGPSTAVRLVKELEPAPTMLATCASGFVVVGGPLAPITLISTSVAEKTRGSCDVEPNVEPMCLQTSDCGDGTSHVFWGNKNGEVWQASWSRGDPECHERMLHKLHEPIEDLLVSDTTGRRCLVAVGSFGEVQYVDPFRAESKWTGLTIAASAGRRCLAQCGNFLVSSSLPGLLAYRLSAVPPEVTSAMPMTEAAGPAVVRCSALAAMCRCNCSCSQQSECSVFVLGTDGSCRHFCIAGDRAVHDLGGGMDPTSVEASLAGLEKQQALLRVEQERSLSLSKQLMRAQSALHLSNAGSSKTAAVDSRSRVAEVSTRVCRINDACSPASLGASGCGHAVVVSMRISASHVAAAPFWSLVVRIVPQFAALPGADSQTVVMPVNTLRREPDGLMSATIALPRCSSQLGLPSDDDTTNLASNWPSDADGKAGGTTPHETNRLYAGRCVEVEVYLCDPTPFDTPGDLDSAGCVACGARIATQRVDLLDYLQPLRSGGAGDGVSRHRESVSLSLWLATQLPAVDVLGEAISAACQVANLEQSNFEWQLEADGAVLVARAWLGLAARDLEIIELRFNRLDDQTRLTISCTSQVGAALCRLALFQRCHAASVPVKVAALDVSAASATVVHLGQAEHVLLTEAATPWSMQEAFAAVAAAYRHLRAS